MVPSVGVAVVGAGPYGLSVAAHLAGQGIKARVFGRPMETWQSFMPKGMVLKSEGFAMDLSHPDGQFTLGDYCAEQGIPYQKIGWPVPVEVFAAYGAAFQKRFVPHVETTDVLSIEAVDDGFELELSTGEHFVARSVVMATGIRSFFRMPEETRGLPADRISHSSLYGEMSHFEGKRVAVLGGGASAMDIAAALYRSGAEPTVVTRHNEVKFFSPHSFRSIRDRLLAPMTPLGPGWKKYLCVAIPDLFRMLPVDLRRRILSRYLGPSPAWSTRDIIQNCVEVVRDSTVSLARVEGDQVALTLTSSSEPATTINVDHVIAATGYEVETDRFPALSAGLRKRLRAAAEGGVPRLSRTLETAVPRLYVVGTPSAHAFGPMMRFVCGTSLAASRVTSGVVAAERARQRSFKPATQLEWQPSGSAPV